MRLQPVSIKVEQIALPSPKASKGGSVDGPGPSVAGGTLYVKASTAACRVTLCWRSQWLASG
jgi:hypothetical protein